MGVAGHNTRLIPGVLEEGKARILDELITIASHHHKHGFSLLPSSGDEVRSQHCPRVDALTKKPLARPWSYSGRLPAASGGRFDGRFAPTGGVHGACHLHLDPEVSQPLLAPGAATLDSLLKPVRAAYGSWHKRRRRLAPGSRLPHRGENLC